MLPLTEDLTSLEKRQRHGQRFGKQSPETAKGPKIIHAGANEGQFNKELQVNKRLLHKDLLLSGLYEEGKYLKSELEDGSYYILGLLLNEMLEQVNQRGC